MLEHTVKFTTNVYNISDNCSLVWPYKPVLQCLLTLIVTGRRPMSHLTF